jgi:hypothetical protein
MEVNPQKSPSVQRKQTMQAVTVEKALRPNALYTSYIKGASALFQQQILESEVTVIR